MRTRHLTAALIALGLSGCSPFGGTHGASFVHDGTVVYAVGKLQQSAGYFLQKARFIEYTARSPQPVQPTYAGPGHYRVSLARPNGWDFYILAVPSTSSATPSINSPNTLEWDELTRDASSSATQQIYQGTIIKSLVGVSGAFTLQRTLNAQGQPSAMTLQLDALTWPDGKHHPFQQSFNLAPSAGSGGGQNVQEGDVQQGDVQVGSGDSSLQEGAGDQATATGSITVRPGLIVAFTRSDDEAGNHDVVSQWSDGLLELHWSADWTGADGVLRGPDGLWRANVTVQGPKARLVWSDGQVSEGPLWGGS